MKRSSWATAGEAIEIVDAVTGQERTIETPTVFVYQAQRPLPGGCLPRSDCRRQSGVHVHRNVVCRIIHSGAARRPPFLLETSHPGVFAAGDVRSGSVKRVASAVGEGAMSVQFVHEYLKEM